MSTIYCHSCGAPLSEGARFCSQCGEKVVEQKPRCPQCGIEVASEAKFCSSCGAKLKESPAPRPTPAAESPNGRPGSAVVKDGRTWTVGDDQILRRDENGAPYVDAASYFSAHFNQASENQTAGYQEVQPEPAPPQNNVSPQAEANPYFEAFVRKQEAYPTQEEDPDNDTNGHRPPNGKPKLNANDSAAHHGPSSGMPDEIPSMNMLEFLSQNKPKKKKVEEQSLPKKGIHKKERFKKTVNLDGYYDDRQPIDTGLYEEYNQKIKTGQLVIGLGAIAIFAFLAIQLQNLLL